jgi:hypothetical protein
MEGVFSHTGVESRTIEDVLILDFWKVLKTGDFTILGVSEENWNDLYDEYFKAKNDASSKKFLSDLKEEALTLFKISFALEMITFLEWVDRNGKMIKGSGEKIQETLSNVSKAFGIKIDGKQKLQRIVNSLQNKYKGLVSSKQKKAEKEIENVYKLVAAVGRMLEIQLNVKEMTVAEWLAWEEMAREKSNALNKKKNGRPVS